MSVEFESVVKFNHFGIGAGNATIAFQMSKDRSGNTRTVRFGYALCSPKDHFSKNDIYKTVYGPIERDENGRPTNLNTRKNTKVLVHEGGRSIALNGKRGLNTNPITMEIGIPFGENVLSHVINEMQNFIYDHAPRWRDHSKLKVLKNGGIFLARDGFELTWADPNSENLITFRDNGQTFVM